MALQNITTLNIDFYDKKYILINAKQYDKNSRYLEITCYNRGQLVSINSGEHSAYVRYKKSDDYSVFNECEINRYGKIIVKLTEQMLSSDGICYADLVIVNEGDAKVDTETGDILYIENASILSTMTFCIDVSGTATENSDIESSYEFDGLNVALQKAEAEYKEVIQLAKSYAIGNADGIRENEDEDNAKYYYEQASIKASEASDSADDASISEDNAESYMKKALEYQNNANTYMSNSKSYMETTDGYMDTTKGYMETTDGHMQKTEGYMTITEGYMNNAESYTNSANSYMTTTNNYMTITEGYMNNAESYMNSASSSEAIALASANYAQSYATGDSGARNGEETDNALYYYTLTKNIVIGLDTGFIPMGTITFDELATVEKATGYVYNISDDFVTDSSFREGEGKSYTAGTNVYICADGMIDCFGGASSPTATVDEVKTYLGI